MGALSRFFRVLTRSGAGFIGFIGLVFFALLVIVGPLFVPFDGEVKLDQINAPPGARLQLLTRTEDAGTYTTLESLEGRTVGILRSSSGELLVEPFEDREFFEVEDYSRRQIDDALEELSEGDTDALLLFSTLVNEFILRPAEPEFANLAVSNPKIGPIHLLGADTQGRDIFSHIVNGGRTLIVTALLAGLISTAIAVLFGMLAALVGGVVDRVLTSIANFILVIPRFPLLVVLAALFTLDNILLLAALIGLLAWPALMRAVRAQVLSLRERDYVEAASALDLGLGHIISREILPNMMSFVVINLIFAITAAMYDQVGLIFLGMAPINDYSWGVMLFFGRSRGVLFNADSAAMILSPVIAIALFQVSLVMFSRAVEELFDPRLRSA